MPLNPHHLHVDSHTFLFSIPFGTIYHERAYAKIALVSIRFRMVSTQKNNSKISAYQLKILTK